MDKRVLHKMVGDGRRPNLEGLTDRGNIQSHANAGHAEKPLAVVAEVNAGLESLGEKATEEIPTASTDTQPTGDPTAAATSMGANPGPPGDEHDGTITPIRTANGQRHLKNGTYRTVARAQGYQPEVESVLASPLTPSAEYEKNEVDHFLESEKHMVGMSQKYLGSGRGEVTPETRRGLVDSLIESQADFDLHSEVLFMSIFIMDFVCERRNNLTTARFYLIGMVALLVAVKAEEVRSKGRWKPFKPLRQSITEIYHETEVNSMEWEIVTTKGLNIYFPTSLRFLEHFLKKCKGVAVEKTEEIELRAKCIMEIGLFSHQLIGMKPSMIAVACLLLSAKASNRLEKYEEIVANFDFHYSKGEMQPVLHALEDTVKFVMGNKMFRAVNKKYPYTAEEIFGTKLLLPRNTDQELDKDKKISADESTRASYCTVL